MFTDGEVEETMQSKDVIDKLFYRKLLLPGNSRYPPPLLLGGKELLLGGKGFPLDTPKYISILSRYSTRFCKEKVKLVKITFDVPFC